MSARNAPGLSYRRLRSFSSARSTIQSNSPRMSCCNRFVRRCGVGPARAGRADGIHATTTAGLRHVAGRSAEAGVDVGVPDRRSDRLQQRNQPGRRRTNHRGRRKGLGPARGGAVRAPTDVGRCDLAPVDLEGSHRPQGHPDRRGREDRSRSGRRRHRARGRSANTRYAGHSSK